MINKMWYEYYSAVKRKEVLVYAPRWLNLERIISVERSQSQRTTCCMISFSWNVQNRQMYRDRISGCQAEGRVGHEQWLLRGIRFLFWMIKMF